MSIEVKKEGQKENFLSLTWNFNPTQPSGNIVVLDDTQMEKKEEKKIKVEAPKKIKKKVEPQIRMYYEAVLEAYNKGIRNRCHTFDGDGDSDDINKPTYYCPLACVTELLKYCKPTKKHHERASQYDHFTMQDKVYERIQFVNDSNKSIKCKQILPDGTECYKNYHGFDYSSEPFYSIHLANRHHLRNDVVAAILKKELYEGKESYKLHHDPKFVEMQNKKAEQLALERENARKAHRKQYRLERRQRLKALSKS